MAFFFFLSAGNLAMEVEERWKSSGGERKREKRIVEKKERETYTIFFRFRDRYGM